IQVVNEDDHGPRSQSLGHGLEVHRKAVAETRLCLERLEVSLVRSPRHQRGRIHAEGLKTLPQAEGGTEHGKKKQELRREVSRNLVRFELNDLLEKVTEISLLDMSVRTPDVHQN